MMGCKHLHVTNVVVLSDVNVREVKEKERREGEKG